MVCCARRSSGRHASPGAGSGDEAAPATREVTMALLPTGTVTFLFTDIAGSTRLLQQVGEGYAEALDANPARRAARLVRASRCWRDIRRC
jgi:class 3 adenylate cyclase